MYVIGCIAQKGGVGKSAVAGLLAREFAQAEYIARIADMDIQQQTSVRWVTDRLENGHGPKVEASFYKSVKEALREAADADVLIFDGKPLADAQTSEIALRSDLVVLPTGVSVNDLRPTVQLVHALLEAKVNPKKIVVVLLSQMTAAEESDARGLLERAGLTVAKNAIKVLPIYRAALNNGQALSEARHKDSAAKAAAVAEELANIMTEASNGN